MKDLIVIALVYSYVVNGQRELPDYEVACFVDSVKKKLSKLRSKYDIREKHSRGFFDNVPCTINVRSEEDGIKVLNLNSEDVDLSSSQYMNNPIFYYSFASIERDLVEWISYLDRDLISATLSEEALHYLNVKRTELPIKTEKSIRTGNTVIYSLVEKDAYDKALCYLKEDGYEDISIGRGMPIQIDDKAYQFYFSANMLMSSLDTHDKNMYKKIANLKTILDMEAYKSEVLSKGDKDAKFNLNDFFLAKTVLLDRDNNTVSRDYRAVIKLTGDEEAFYNSVVTSMSSGSSDVTVFIDLLGYEIMNFFWQGKFGDKKYERVVEDITLLCKSMGIEYATLEEISQHIDKLNEKNIMKELK